MPVTFKALKKPITITNKHLGEISVTPEVPQYDTLEEIATAAQGEKHAVNFFNRAAQDKVKSAVRAYLTNVAEGTPLETVVARAMELGRNFNIRTASTKVPVAARAAAGDAVASLIASGEKETFTREELLALMDAQIKKAMEESEKE